jgi:hypothetical protein
MHHNWFGAVTIENGSELGVVRRFFRFGFVSPARLRIWPTVLAAGQFTLGFMRSSRALSFLAPQDGNRLRSARTSFSISVDVE